VSRPDEATRERLLREARLLFSERGFKRVAVREICRAARANVAAVNYHFGDKLGLYLEVVQEAIAVMRETSEESMRAADDASAEERIRNYIRVYVRNIVGRGRDSWIHRIMQHEQQDPTPALDIVVEQAIRPRIIYLCGCVAELLGCGPMEDRVLLAVASIQGQCLIYLHSAISARLIPGARGESFDIETLANHIAEFSLAGLRAMAISGGGLDDAPNGPYIISAD
jgi:AcrR family transcriptional regulator